MEVLHDSYNDTVLRLHDTATKFYVLRAQQPYMHEREKRTLLIEGATVMSENVCMYVIVPMVTWGRKCVHVTARLTRQRNRHETPIHDFMRERTLNA